MRFFTIFILVHLSFYDCFEIQNDFNYCPNNCTIIKSVNIVENVDICTKDVYISFKDNGLEKYGYLLENLTIVEQSIEVNCSDNETILQSGKDLIVTRLRHFVEIELKNSSNNDLKFYYSIAMSFLLNIVNDSNDYVFIALIHIIFILYLIQRKRFISQLNLNKKPEQVQRRISKISESDLVFKEYKPKIHAAQDLNLIYQNSINNSSLKYHDNILGANLGSVEIVNEKDQKRNIILANNNIRCSYHKNAELCKFFDCSCKKAGLHSFYVI